MLTRAMKTKDVYTENGMPAHSTTMDACLDFFATAGSCRSWSEEDILAKFSKAMAENPLVALRTLFYVRDVRGGMGERRVFDICVKYLNDSFEYRKHLDVNIHLIPEFGRWKDIFALDNDLVLKMIKDALEQGDGLLAKWLPRKGPFANKVRKHLGLTPRDYRKRLVSLSKTVEQNMCAKEWNEINYEHVPSIAMNKYRKAFLRNDGDRFNSYINGVKSGVKKIHSGTLFPYHLYEAYRKREDKNAVEAQWESLPNFMENNDHIVLPICDVSGSMLIGQGSPTPMSISVSLGIYISERNPGVFKDVFMTFSGWPNFQVLKGSFYDRCRQLETAHWEMNTDIGLAFKMLLQRAKEYNVPAKHMPGVILIISDMQFDRCADQPDNTSMEMIRSSYERHGYEMPKIVFWNVNARRDNIPVQFDEKGTAIVSGCTPAILTSVLSGDIMDPVNVMMKAISAERYKKVKLAYEKEDVKDLFELF